MKLDGRRPDAIISIRIETRQLGNVQFAEKDFQNHKDYPDFSLEIDYK